MEDTKKKVKGKYTWEYKGHERRTVSIDDDEESEDEPMEQQQSSQAEHSQEHVQSQASQDEESQASQKESQASQEESQVEQEQKEAEEEQGDTSKDQVDQENLNDEPTSNNFDVVKELLDLVAANKENVPPKPGAQVPDNFMEQDSDEEEL